MTQSQNLDKKTRTRSGVLLFGLGAVSGIFVTLVCAVIAAVLWVLPIQSESQQNDITDADLDAHVELVLGEDGCHVVRGEVEGSTPVSSLTWVMKDMEGYTFLERNAQGEYDTKFNRGGQYKVHLKGWYNGQYHQISDEITVDCPQGP